jgi:hypothetical protein
MSRILSEMKKMATRARMEATSGWVTTREKSGVRCVWMVRKMPNAVVTKVRSGLATEGGRSLGSRVT